MDPNNVYIINDGIDITPYNNHFCSRFKECVTMNISNWDKNVIKTFYVHNSSTNPDKKEEFTSKILLHVIDIITRNFEFKESDSHIKYLPQGSVHLKPHSLYLSAVALTNGKYKNIFNKCFDIATISIEEVILAEIHSQSQIRELYKSAIRNKPINSSHIVYTLVVKNTIGKFINLRIIEALSLSCDEETREETTTKVFEDTMHLFTLLKIVNEKLGSLILIDETSVLQNSAHVFQLLIHVCKHPLYKNMATDGCNALTNKSCNVIEKPILAYPYAYNELKTENQRLNDVVKEYKKRYCNLLQYTKRSKESITKKTSREILDKLSDSHNELIRSQQEKYEEIISITKQNHDEKFQTLTDYYNERLRNQAAKLQSYDNVNEECKNLKEENDALKASIFSYKEKLENIQNLIQDRPQTTTNLSTIFALPKQETSRTQTNTDSTQSKVRDLKKQVNDLQAKNEKLMQQSQSKDNTIENYLQQIKYLKDVIADGEKNKKLMEQENFELSRSIENIQKRHNEQFKEYDKLLKKRRQENELHKREIMRLREHFNSENYPSPALIRKRRQLNISSSSPKSPIIKTGKQISLSQPLPENVSTPIPLIEKEISEPSLSQESVPTDALSEISPSAVEREDSLDFDFSDVEDPKKIKESKGKTPQSSQSSITIVTLSSTSSDAARFATLLKKGVLDQKSASNSKKCETGSQSSVPMPSSNSSIQMSSLSTPSTASAFTIKTGRSELQESNGKRLDTDSDSARSTPIPTKRPRGRPRKLRQQH